MCQHVAPLEWNKQHEKKKTLFRKHFTGFIFQAIDSWWSYLQMSMSAPAMRQMSVTPTPCVLTLKHPMCAVVQLDSLEMAEIVQV